MTSPTRVLVVGLDACDPDIARDLADRGEMPNLARLFEQTTVAPIRNPFGIFVGAVWRSFATGRHGNRAGLFCWDEIDRETYAHRLADPALDHIGRPFWLDISDAGHRVAVIDVPHAALVPVHGVHIIEWGCHDRHHGLQTAPGELRDELVARYGTHPIFGKDAFETKEFAPDDYVFRAGPLRTAEEEHAFTDGMLAGLDTKQRLVADQLGAGDWDLFLAVFGETHAVGHQQWHLHDPAHPRHDAAVAAAIGGDPITRTYSAADRALGALLDQVDDETTVVVLLSHGMGPHYDGTHVLDEILGRLTSTDGGGPMGGGVSRAGKQLIGRAAPSLQRRVGAALRRLLRSRVASTPPAREWIEPDERASRPYFWRPNNSVYGGVRFNVRGRETRGVLDPADVEALRARLTADLLALVNVETGGPVVNAVIDASDAFDRESDDTLPDLFIDWERSAPIEVVWSARTGLVCGSYAHWRTGDHRPEGLMLLRRRGLSAGATRPAVDVEDIGPTIAGWLGVTVPEADGRAVPWLATAEAPA